MIQYKFGYAIHQFTLYVLLWIKELLNIETGPFRSLLRLAACDQVKDAGVNTGL